SATTIGIVELIKVTSVTPGGSIVVSVLALVIGAVSFTGSVLAYLKLEGTLRKQWVIPMHNIWNVLILLIMTVIGVLMTMNGEAGGILLFLLVVLALFYGVFFVFPIGGADMPVVISLLNSLTGLSAAAAGAIYDNKAMLIGGIL